MALIIAGERSGVGKTTVTLSLLAALRSRLPQATVQSFKVGPDYIDPMFHTYVTGHACRNLDPVLTSETYVQQCFNRHTAEYALIEGVMGLFDGACGKDDTASTAHIARLLNVPIVLILNCSSTSRSIAAIAHGYRSFDPRLQIAGVILNRVGSDRHLELLTEALEPLNLPILGVLRRQEDIAIPDRHLGLVPTAELKDLDQAIEKLAHLGETCFDWEKLLPLLSHANSGRADQADGRIERRGEKVRLAIAQDRAFSFYYADNLDLLRQLGAELVPWSPMEDVLPEGVQGLYLGGGFPEVFAGALAENVAARRSVRLAIESGMPTYAECGGLMYLCDQIVDFEGNTYPMVGIFPTTAAMGKRLTLGYRQATALQDSPLVQKGDRFWGHEFHRSALRQTEDGQSVEPSERPLLSLQGYDSKLQFPDEGWQRHQVHASYVHLHFGAQPRLAAQFLQHCETWSFTQCTHSLYWGATSAGATGATAVDRIAPL
ncbi:MAG TPA: cobyrinate a,c-diamide synthase [Coleofasciculaceae cyanobacterium]|jgi:cobyrinic acid a,c-diamide synthase